MSDSQPPQPNAAPPSLKARTVNTAMWATGQFAAQSGLRLASNLILTRLLAPEAFGLIGAVLLIQFLIEMISDVGIRSSVIRSAHSDDPAFVSTAYVLQVARAIIITLIVLTGAGAVVLANRWGWIPAGSIYADPRLPGFILLGAIASFIQGLASINILLAERSMSIARLSIIQTGAQVISSIVSIWIAWATANPIALAYGIIAKPAVIGICSFLFFAGPKFSLTVRKVYVKEMLSYGVWILVASLFSFFADRGAQLLLGFFLDAREFSFLSIAIMLITIVRQGLRTIQRRVALPVFSELRRTRPQEQRRGYLRMRLVSDVSAVIVFLGAFLLAGPILDVLYPDDYARVIYYVQLLSISVLFVPFELLDTILLSEGSSRQFSVIKFILAAAVVVGIPLTFNLFGAQAAVLYSGITAFAAVPLSWYYGSKVIKLDWRHEAVLPVLAAIAFGYLVVHG